MKQGFLIDESKMRKNLRKSSLSSVKKQAIDGDVLAIFEMGDRCNRIYGLAESLEAIEWYKKAEEYRHDEHNNEFNIGFSYHITAKLYCDQLSLKDRESLTSAGNRYFKKADNIETSISHMKIFNGGLETKLKGEDYYWVGREYLSQWQYREAFKWEDHKGDIFANEAFQFFTKAEKSAGTESINDELWHTLAKMYNEGLGTKKNNNKAFNYAKKAYERGGSFYASLLARFYRDGVGVQKNSKEELRLIEEHKMHFGSYPDLGPSSEAIY